jgi:DNA polymerase V
MSSTSSKPVLWALVDCESFYCSCERLFRPDLADKPIVVLSNNDGCLVSMTVEAKALGFKGGEPYFKVAEDLKRAGVAVFSSNYTLYADLSRRVMASMAGVVPEVEQYSIDEAFLPFSKALAAQAEEVGWRIHDRVRRWTGIPVRVGIGPTKTLAKLANHWAKKISRVLLLDAGSDQLETLLRSTPVKDVWGIGRRLAGKLGEKGITTAWHLREMKPKDAKKLLNVLGQRTILELQGQPCLEESPTIRKTLFNSRSFGSPVTDKEELREALAFHCGVVGERLRSEGLLAGGLSIYIATSWHVEESFQTGATINLSPPTDDTLAFVKAANQALEQCFRMGHKYMKAGILLLELAPPGRSGNLLDQPQDADRQSLMGALDEINAKYGRGTARFAGQGETDASWHMKRSHKSGHLTTSWGELAKVNS